MTFRALAEPLYEWHIRSQCRHIPRHIAIIQDGNRRFARQERIQTSEGHRAGASITESMLDWARDLGIRYVTLYSFSTENFMRDSNEIQALFSLFKEKFSHVPDDDRVQRYHIRVQVIGDRSLLPPELCQEIAKAESATAGYDEFFLNVALAYGGRNEILSAVRDILAEIRTGTLLPAMITPEVVEHHLTRDNNLPPVDLIIRTGNEYRTSNFLPWLANGHECAVYFCAPFWPMFRKIDLLRAIRVYSQRIDSSLECPVDR